MTGWRKIAIEKTTYHNLLSVVRSKNNVNLLGLVFEAQFFLLRYWGELNSLFETVM